MRDKNVTIIVPILLYVNSALYGWGNENTHPALTERSLEVDSTAHDYFKTRLGLDGGLSTQLQLDATRWPAPDLIERGMNQNIPTRSIVEWFREGSKLEDAKLRQARSRHHFHDPTRNAGLENKTDHPNYSGLLGWATARFSTEFDATGQSAAIWAIHGTAAQQPTTNYNSWESGREYFYRSLTEESDNTREHYLALACVTLGHVLHMLEDMGVPAHTRNDFIFGHLQYEWPSKIGNPLEGWVEEQVKQNGGQCPWSGTDPVIFAALANYFDADVYDGDYLGDGVQPPSTWGLSECSNYQFLSLSTIFCPNDRSLYYFPHPSQDKMGTPILEGSKIYFNGINYGVAHMARDSYTYYKTIYGHYMVPPHVMKVVDSTNTTDDVAVFEDYADVTVPRTINYAAGLLNYFFRGKLAIEPNGLDGETVTFEIRNISDNSGVAQTLKGGTFEVFWDTADGDRIRIDDFTIPGWTTSSELDYGQHVTGTFSNPGSDDVKKYTVVYRGQISEDPAEADVDDSNAIAVATLRMGYPIIAWGQGQVGGVPEGNDFIAVAAGKNHGLAIRSSGSLVAWGSNSSGQCNVPEGSDFIAIAGGAQHSLALRSDGSLVGFGNNALGQIDVPEGNNFVAIACGDYHSLAINRQGRVVGWGGHNAYHECDAPEPDSGTSFVAVSAGSYHSLGLQSDGTIRAWGSNNQGQTRIYAGAGDDHKAIAAIAKS